MSDDICYCSKTDCYEVPSEIYELMDDAVEELKRILASMPINADGDVILPGDEVWFCDPDRSIFEPDGVICEEVSSIFVGTSFEEYEGNFTICCDSYEAGNKEFYSSRESCLKANLPPESEE